MFTRANNTFLIKKEFSCFPLQYLKIYAILELIEYFSPLGVQYMLRESGEIPVSTLRT